jgi:hypothetical protein
LQKEAELVLLHAGGLSQGNTCEELHCQHPSKPMPHQETVSEPIKRFLETGSMADKKRNGHTWLSTDPNHTTNVSAEVEVNPHRSTRKMDLEARISHSCVARTYSETSTTLMESNVGTGMIAIDIWSL